ncbi:MAG: NUDIX domain-containing protein [Cytophagales bacterium]|nr:NUDIX domain-containing protein [Cytophagales bacterium]MDW8383154.1 NUDIX domain-containing protein [Flammeovirgaceae bacterium]
MRFYVKNYPFTISAQQINPLPEDAVVYNSASASQIWQIYESVFENRITGHSHFIFIEPHYEQILQEFLSHFKIVDAAGALVQHQDKYLFIYRFESWDLPKGKLEDQEDPVFNAIREVKEECNLNIKVRSELLVTHHTYVLENNHVFKNTKWFLADCIDENPAPIPQVVEGIQKAEWFTKQEVEEIVLKNTYPSIREVWQTFLHLCDHERSKSFF